MNSEHRIVLAGGSGFLGRSLAAVLISKGYEVVVLGRAAAQGTSLLNGMARRLANGASFSMARWQS